MKLVDFIQKANLSNVMIIAGIFIGLVTFFNRVDVIDSQNNRLKSQITSLESTVNQQKIELIEHKHKITSLENSNDKFDKTLITVNNTLSELNGTIQGLKATVESMKK
ncbi:hypothetical protein EX461_18090 [Vibrio parahaemolyticus]|nr:hypothetical protein [Vibrio parahaemolyticus]